ncbi:MAG TPA: hypothetical protein ENJ19_06995 [Gammaproteobacteria bacterium]|nr:hypothetical protein [Gammaproteobacteria bacterium]
MSQLSWPLPALLLWTVGLSVAWAHDPVFGPGPHVLFKNGVELHLGVESEKAGPDRRRDLDLELSYGLSGDWAAGVVLPYRQVKAGAADSGGAGDISVFSKYRFWRSDRLGVQESAALLVKLSLDNGDNDQAPPLGSGTLDTLLGLTYGFESLKWYRWAGVRYRRSGETGAGLRRGGQWWVDAVLGWRPAPPVYRKPDTVWLVELNVEHALRAEQHGVALADTGGTEWFVSPGVFWTWRNVAVKGGVQFPVASDLRSRQDNADYRAKIELEWHL